MNRVAPLWALLMIAIPAGTASAAEVRVAPGTDGTPRVIFQAAPGELNRATMTSVPSGQSFGDFGPALIAGSGCEAGPPVLCRVFLPVEAHLGDRDDVGFFNGFYGGGDAVYGDDGNDDFVVGSNTDAFGFGGAGDDTIRLSTDGQANGFGGTGDDRIGGGFSQSADVFQGDSGDDLLVSH